MPNVYYFKQTNYNFSRNSTMQIILLQARTLCITTIKLISICLWGVMYTTTSTRGYQLEKDLYLTLPLKIASEIFWNFLKGGTKPIMYLFNT